jgi:O-antigen/teichoic acid export membrane protein
LSLYRHGDVLIASTAALLVTLAGLAVLVGPYGARGAAVATLIAEVTVAASMAGLLLRARPDIKLPVVTVGWIALASAPALAVALIPGLPVVADVALGCAVYLGVLAAARRIPEELLQAARRR